ncbi:MAG TPA: putative baseplate assembly protein [Candidatus Limnocylindria bacterium]|nr:putative baseplate assembly protein [Candidatus Limnocylindria bacterium]
MALPVPNLDDRRFQDLVDEAKRLVQQRCPEWTDHNVSDPGVTLIETFAWMTDQLIYRLNRVPDRNYVKFLELIGVTLFPPTAARTDATFWLTGPQPDVVRIPPATQVATVRTETDEAIIFATTEELPIISATLVQIGSMPKGKSAYRDLLPSVELGRDAFCFQEKPQLGDALLIGLSQPVPSNAIRLRFKCDIEGVGVNPDHPPLLWEAWDGADWIACEQDSDTTGGLNRDGDVVIHVPRGHAAHSIGTRHAAWVRARIVEPLPGMSSYEASPTVSFANSITIGGTVEAVNAAVVSDENVGVSEGVPGQRFELRRKPVLSTDEPAKLVVSTGDDADGTPTWSTWEQVGDFAASGPNDRHFVLDGTTGEIRFGPAVRQLDGSLRQYGASPGKDRYIRMLEYRTGGGARGNVSTGSVKVLKSSIPFVSRVENRRDARGGVDGEDIENAKVRGPIRLRTRGRAVTTEDFEHLAREAAPNVGRVRAVAAGDGAQAGAVRLLVVPSLPSAEGRVRFDQLVPDPTLLEAITQRLEECRVIGTRISVEPPGYRGVTVEATVLPASGANPNRLKADAERALYEYLHPITGGPVGTGWPFGRPVTIGEIYSVLQRVPGAEVVESVNLFGTNAETGGAREATPRLEIKSNVLVFSVAHTVTVPGANAVAA